MLPPRAHHWPHTGLRATLLTSNKFFLDAARQQSGEVPTGGVLHNVFTMQDFSPQETTTPHIEGEEWRLCLQTHGGVTIEASSLGRLRCTRTFRGKRIRYTAKCNYDSTTGYKKIGFRSDNKYFKMNVHVAVCNAFHGPRPQGYVADHINRNRLDNRPQNLRWVTPKESNANRGAIQRHDIYAFDTTAPWPNMAEAQADLICRFKGYAALTAFIGQEKKLSIRYLRTMLNAQPTQSAKIGRYRVFLVARGTNIENVAKRASELRDATNPHN